MTYTSTECKNAISSSAKESFLSYYQIIQPIVLSAFSNTLLSSIVQSFYRHADKVPKVKAATVGLHTVRTARRQRTDLPGVGSENASRKLFMAPKGGQ